jgi:RimJ/RimL family protein N-acetyltransferase
MLKGKIIELVPAALDDRRAVYDWCFHCETSKSHSGADFPDIIIPGYEEFCEDYADYFFTGAELHNGRGFMIKHKGEAVGFISYCSYHLKAHISELDIWLNSEKHCGKGFGTDAIITLGGYINQTLGIQKAIMAPAKKNTRAIASYKKAGFEESGEPMSAYLLEKYVPIYGGGDYGEEHTAVLVKRF